LFRQVIHYTHAVLKERGRMIEQLFNHTILLKST
jgi:hypothetical protein